MHAVKAITLTLFKKRGELMTKQYKVRFKTKNPSKTHEHLPTSFISTALELAKRELECGHDITITVLKQDDTRQKTKNGKCKRCGTSITSTDSDKNYCEDCRVYLDEEDQDPINEI